MKIAEALKTCQYSRIQMSNRWMTCGSPGFVVLETVKGRTQGKVIIRTADEDEAVKELIKGEPLYKDV